MSDDIFDKANEVDEVEPSSSYLTKRGRRGTRGNNNTDHLTPRLVKCTLNDVHRTFGKWLYLEKSDFQCIDTVLAAALDRDIPGDPVWLYMVAPSGGMKSETLMSLKDYSRIYTLSSLTPKTFVSGKWTTDIKTGKKVLAGILVQLDGRILVFKDFTVVLDMRDKDRYEIYAQLRDIYDGFHEKGFGTLNFKVSIKATMGCILGVTPIIDRHQKCHNTMGERFLKIRQHPNPKKTTKQSYKNLGKEKEMRAEFKAVVNDFLTGLNFEDLPKPIKKQRNEIEKMARYIALMRAWVHAKTWHGTVISLDLPEPEVPTRVVKQLGILAVGLALIRGHKQINEEDMNTLRRISRDTSLELRQRLVDSMVKDEKEWDGIFPKSESEYPFTYASLSNSSKVHYNSLRIEVDKMVALGILDAKTKIESDGKVVVEGFKFHKDFGELVKAVQCVDKEEELDLSLDKEVGEE